MTEQEYIDVTNLMLLRSARNELIQVVFNDGSVEESRRQEVAANIDILIAKLEDRTLIV